MTLALREAEVAVEEERSWFCVDCDTMLEEGVGGPYCRLCASYWDDVSNGLYEDDWRLEL